MLQKLKLIVLSITSLFIMSVPMVVAGTAAAYTQQNINDCLKQGTNFQFDTTSGTCTPGPQETGTSLDTLVTKIVNILSVIVGIIAVIMIIIGGLRYVTSGG